DKLLNNNKQCGSIKKCLECQTSNINNKKQLCPNCNAKLPTINELKQLNEPLVIANNTEKSLSEWELSEEMKNFSELAHTKRIEFIQKILIEKNFTRTWHPLTITSEEANFQKFKNSLSKKEILSIINSLLPYLNDLDHL
ncbi:7226_t:CDS:2, partial [Racocetra fulgida]